MVYIWVQDMGGGEGIRVGVCGQFSIRMLSISSKICYCFPG
jgi:hypothetical protein